MEEKKINAGERSKNEREGQRSGGKQMRQSVGQMDGNPTQAGFLSVCSVQ